MKIVRREHRKKQSAREGELRKCKREKGKARKKERKHEERRRKGREKAMKEKLSILMKMNKRQAVSWSRWFCELVSLHVYE